MDSTQLERETLESKDRDALVTMATALGGKPGSRARKAEIVDLILEMTAGTKGSSNGSQAEETPKSEEADQQEPLADWEVQVAEEESSATAKESTEDTADDSGGTKKESSEARVQKNQGAQNRQNDQAGPGNRRRRRRGGRDHGSDEAWDGEPLSLIHI